MTTSDYENPEKHLHDADRQVDGSCLSVPKELEVEVSMCGTTVASKFYKITVASELPYYQKDKEMIYKNFSTPRGLVLVINNEKFDHLGKRDGTKVDEKKLKNLFEQFGYKVKILKNRTAEEMIEDAKEFAKNIGHKNAQSCIVVVLSHGGYDELSGKDCSPSNDEEFKKARMKENYDPINHGRVNIHTFLRCFNSKKAPLLANKPKLFFFQACRGKDIDEGIHVTDDYFSTDIPRYSNNKTPTEADFIVCYASAPSYVSIRHPDDGSWFVNAICEVFSKFAAEEDLYFLLTRVNKLVAEQNGKIGGGIPVKQISEFSSRLTKRFYFFPGIKSEGNSLNISRTTHDNDQPRFNLGTYIVKSGDTGTKIAGKCGITFEELSELNPDTVWENLMPGNSLNISRTTHDNDQPRSNLETYVVKSGDTGIKIAGKFRITFEKLSELNPDIVWENLAPGDSLNIPNDQSRHGV